MTEQITIEVDGDPKGQPRARAFVGRTGRARVYDPGTAEGWKAQIAMAARGVLPAEPLQGPLEVNILLRFRRPRCHYRTGKRAAELRPYAPCWHTAKPDRDNCDKSILDALTQLGAWRDDAQVVDGRVAKVWSDRPGATILISAAGPGGPARGDGWRF